jgi:hypothetical protein
MFFKRIAIAWLILASLVASGAEAANTKLSSLGAAAAISGSNLVYVVQTDGSGGVGATVTQFATFFEGLITGDCSINTSTSAITCTKTNGVAFGALATVTPGTGVATALGIAVGTAGGVVTNGGALGTPSSGVGTNLTGTASGLTAGHVTTNANLTGVITSSGNATSFGTFASSVLAAALTDETGTGSAVFGTAPTISSPALTGTPTAPTATAGTNTTQVATTAFVLANAGGGGGSGTVTSVAPGCGNTASPNPITTTGTLSASVTRRANTATTDAIVSTDCGNIVSESNTSVAVSLPQAGTTGFAAGSFFEVCNIGGGSVTITPTTSTIGGLSALVLNGGLSGNPNCIPFQSDGTNYNLMDTVKGSGVQGALANAVSTPGGFASTIASGTATIPATAIASQACGTAITVAATSVATTDVVTAGFAADPTSTTGFLPTAMLTIVPFPTAGNANFKVCNLTSASITPTSLTFNWRVTR